MKYVFLCLCALTGCVTTTFTPTGNLGDSGGDVLFEYPKGEYVNLGLIDVGYYRPGWEAPTLNDALPKVREQVRARGGNAFIVRGQRPGQVAARSIIVSAEVLRVPTIQMRENLNSSATTTLGTAPVVSDQLPGGSEALSSEPAPIYGPVVQQAAASYDIGATFGSSDRGLLVTKLKKNGPAARAGLEVGDVITHVNDEVIARIDQKTAIGFITNSGNAVKLTIAGKGSRLVRLDRRGL